MEDIVTSTAKKEVKQILKVEQKLHNYVLPYVTHFFVYVLTGCALLFVRQPS